MTSTDEMLLSYGQPVVVASDYEIDPDREFPTITFYGVDRPVTAGGLKRFEPGQILVFSSDARFVQEVGFHFNDMRKPDFKGWSSFASLLRNETKLTIFRIERPGGAVLEFSDYVIVVHLEVGRRKKSDSD